ncbi:MAG TPA: alpha/beta hydrolase [Amaricoccus sp.]|nr:alpha/beta hydrolase [Amaricoccus sp.]
MARRRKLWIGLGALGLVVAGTVAFFVYHHPPMRLMPAPLIFQGADAELAPAALADGSRIGIFYATNRLPVGPEADRIYTVVPDRRLHLGQATLRIGEEGSTLDQLRDWTFGADTGDRPFIHLETMAEAASLGADGAGGEPDPDVEAWLAEIDAALAQSADRDILVYVHGANTTVERAAGQASQLRHFSGRHGVVVLFAWPTAENFLRYARDVGTAFASAPHLAELIALLAERTAARNVDVFTYSAGATVGSHALALLAEQNPEAASRLGEVYHAAPDADSRDFVDDLAAYAGAADRVTTAVNLGDSALRLAAAVNRASRAGRPDLGELTPEASQWLLDAAAGGEIEIVQVHPDTMPELAATSHTFWYDDPWVSSDVLVTLLFDLPPAERELDPGVSPSGARYWTFPADYPEHIPPLRDRIRDRLQALRGG